MPELSDFQVGQAIELSDGRNATIRYLGRPHFAAGDWVGVELEDGSGKNDGSVQGQRYFECPPGHGMFVKPTAISVEEDEPTPKPKKAMNERANGAATKGRPPSMGAGTKRQSILDPQAGKRRSINTGSPTPAAKPAVVSRLAVCSILKGTKSHHSWGKETLIWHSLLASLQPSSLARQLHRAILQGQIPHLVMYESLCYRLSKALAPQWLLLQGLL